MVALTGWQALVVAIPPAQGPYGHVPAHMEPDRGIPLRGYYCRVCGYVETYLARVVAPEAWPRG